MPDLLPPIPQSYWVSPQLLAGAYPGATDRQAALEKVGALIAAGVTQFVDLTDAGEGLAPYDELVSEVAPNGGVVHQSLPVPDWTAPSAEVVRHALALIDDETARRGVTYVHCHGGVGRTGSIIGCWLARDMGGEAALVRLQDLRAEAGASVRCSPETPEQYALVRGWPKVRPDEVSPA